MDSYEGSQDDPASLHKYLDRAGDPVNRIDPTGQFFGTIIDVFKAASLQAYTRTTVFIATRPILARVAGITVGIFVASQIEDGNALQGVPQFRALSGLQTAEVRFLETLKRGPLYNALSAELKGWYTRKLGYAYQNWLKKNVLRDVISEEVSVSSSTKHTVDYELVDAFVEAKFSDVVDKVQLAKIANKAKETGKNFWYIFLKKPPESEIKKVKREGGNVGWFLEERD